MRKTHIEMLDRLAQAGEIYPNSYTGSGRYTSKSADYAAQLVGVLTSDLDMVEGKHFEIGNDSPRGGWTGEFVRLLPLGRRRKAIKDRRAVAVAAPAPQKTALELADEDRQTIAAWRADGAPHPCPPEVLAIKIAAGVSWKWLENED